MQHRIWIVGFICIPFLAAGVSGLLGRGAFSVVQPKISLVPGPHDFIEGKPTTFSCKIERRSNETQFIWLIRDPQTKRATFWTREEMKEESSPQQTVLGAGTFTFWMRRDFSFMEVVCRTLRCKTAAYTLPEIKKTFPVDSVTLVTPNLVRGKKLVLQCDVKANFTFERVFFREKEGFSSTKKSWTLPDGRGQRFELETDHIVKMDPFDGFRILCAVEFYLSDSKATEVASKLNFLIVHYLDFLPQLWKDFSLMKGERANIIFNVSANPKPDAKYFKLAILDSFSGSWKFQEIHDAKVNRVKDGRQFTIQLHCFPSHNGTYRVFYTSELLNISSAEGGNMEVSYFEFLSHMKNMTVSSLALARISFLVRANPQLMESYVTIVHRNSSTRIVEVANISAVKIAPLRYDIVNASVSFEADKSGFFMIVLRGSTFSNKTFETVSDAFFVSYCNPTFSKPNEWINIISKVNKLTSISFMLASLEKPSKRQILVNRLSSEGELLEQIAVQTLTTIVSIKDTIFKIRVILSPTHSGTYCARVFKKKELSRGPQFRIDLIGKGIPFHHVFILVLLPVAPIIALLIVFRLWRKKNKSVIGRPAFLYVVTVKWKQYLSTHYVSPDDTLKSLVNDVLPDNLYFDIQSLKVDKQTLTIRKDILMESLQSLKINPKSFVVLETCPFIAHVFLHTPLAAFDPQHHSLPFSEPLQSNWTEAIKERFDLNKNEDIVAFQWGIIASSSSQQSKLCVYDSEYETHVFVDEENGVRFLRTNTSKFYRSFLLTGSSMSWAPNCNEFRLRSVVEVYRRSSFYKVSNNGQKRIKVDANEITSPKWLLMLRGVEVKLASGACYDFINLNKGFCQLGGDEDSRFETDSEVLSKFKENDRPEVEEKSQSFFLLLGDRDPLPRWKIPPNADLEIFCRRNQKIKLEHGHIFRDSEEEDQPLSKSFEWTTPTEEFFLTNLLREVKEAWRRTFELKRHRSASACLVEEREPDPTPKVTGFESEFVTL